MLELHTELTLVSALHPCSWTSHTSLPEPPWIRRVSAAHPERINSLRLQTSPLTQLLPAAAGDVLCPCSSSVWSQLDQARGYQRHMEDQSRGHRSTAGHTSTNISAPVTQCRVLSLLLAHTDTHLDAREVSPTRDNQGAHSSPQAAVTALNHTEGSGLGHTTTAAAPDPPCLEQAGFPSTPVL